MIPLEVLDAYPELKAFSGEAIQSSDVTTDDPALAVLSDLVAGLASGSDISDLKVPLLQLTGSQEERAKLVRSLILSHDYSRLAKFLIIRDRMEKLTMENAINRELTPSETLAFLRIARDEIDKIQGSISEGAASAGDVTTMLNKVHFAAKIQEDELAKKMKGSPQNRELVRKIIYQLSKLSRKKA